MKTLTIAVLTGAVSLGLWSFLSEQTPGVDPMVSGSIPARAAAGHSYTISNAVANTACLAERGSPISSRSARFVAAS